jgi:hypothetical protein
VSSEYFIELYAPILELSGPEPVLKVSKYDNVDVRQGVPPGGVLFKQLPAGLEFLEEAGILHVKALTGFVEKKTVGKWNPPQWKPVHDGWVLEDGWEAKAVQHSNRVRMAEEEAWEAAHAAKKAKAAERTQAGLFRAANASRASQTRRRNKLLAATPYGRFLAALQKAQQASDQAKSRAANGLKRRQYEDGSEYEGANYYRSRCARDRDYQKKAQCIDEACAMRLAMGEYFQWGWRQDGSNDVPWVVYFDLLTGQVSFHARKRGPGPNYAKTWDGVQGASPQRIEEAIHLLEEQK